MIDGLYRVVTASFVAAFVVEGGRVTQCAPILQRRAFSYWMRVAERVSR